jgi:arylformamidase
MKLIDVSVPLDNNLPTYPGNTPYSLEPIKRIANRDTSNVSTLRESANSGTHVDGPRHFFDEDPGVEGLPLDLLCGRARVIELTTRKGITADDLAKDALSEDVRVLIGETGIYEMPCLPLPIVGSDGAPARVVLRRS